MSPESIDPSWGIAACVDVETTGLNPRTHEVVELAIVLFAFERTTGKAMGIVDEYVGQREPGRAIPADAARVHGLTRAMLKSKTLDEVRIRSLGERAEFYIAHNMAYGLVSNKDFVRHGGTKEPDLSVEDAEFFLQSAAVCNIYLIRRLRESDEERAGWVSTSAHHRRMTEVAWKAQAQNDAPQPT